MRISPRWTRIVTFLIAIAGGTNAAYAQVAPASAADCHRVDSSMERLACYDAVTGRTGEAGQETKPATEAVPRDAAALSPRLQAPARARPSSLSMIDAAWAFDPASSRYTVDFYRANYLLFARYTNRVNNRPFNPLFEAAGVPSQELDDVESAFQVSFKARLWTTDDRRWGLWAAYTQASHWQIYNDDGPASRPFRETNYMPELFVSYRPGIALPGGFQWNLLNAGFNHQSNGRSDLLSRSWDRIIAELGVERDNLALFAKAWYRIKESESRDDNPDITDYLGHAELSALYRWRDHTFVLSGRGNVRTGKGAAQFTWTSPRVLGPFHAYVKLFSGYGESLIDYNWKQTTIGAGIALSSGL